MNAIKNLLFITFLFGVGLVDAAVYKWIDDDGQMHYSDKKITKDDTVEIKLPSNPSDADVGAANEKLNQLKQNLETSTKLREQEAQKQKDVEAKALQKKKKCLELFDILDHMKYARGVYVKDKSGNRVFYDEKTREQRTNQYQNLYNDNCL